MKMQAVVNPRAASGKALKSLARIKRKLLQAGHEADWSITSSAEEMSQVIMAAKDRGVQAILVAGGDGTLHAALPALLQTTLPLCLVPCGRGNDFARNVGLPRHIEAAVDYPPAPGSRNIDIPEINGKPFGSVGCMGFDARVNELARISLRFLGGAPAYIWSVIRALRSLDPIALAIRIDDDEWKVNATMVSIANGAYYGGGMKIAPEAQVDDGLLDVCLINEISRWTLLRQFPNLYRGNHTAHPAVTMRKGRTITVRSDKNHGVYADGEHIADLPITCCVGVHTLRILMPAKS